MNKLILALVVAVMSAFAELPDGTSTTVTGGTVNFVG